MFQYDECKPIENHQVTVWLVKFGDGEQRLAVWHKDAQITDVQENIKIHHPLRTFTVSRIDVGEFVINADSKFNTYLSGDGRKINQDRMMVI